jgi:hypothetical protein
MLTHITERQKPRSAKNEAFEVVGKVESSNPVGRHITLYACFGQDCFLLLCTSLARGANADSSIRLMVLIL